MQFDFARLFDASPDVLCLLGAEREVLQVNAAFERTSGWRADQVIGNGLLALLHPDDVPTITVEFDKLAAGAEATRFEGRLRSPDGTFRHLEWTLHPDPAHRTLCVLARDLTDRMRQHERFRLAIQSSPCAMVVANETGTIVMANRETERLFGYDSGELVGQSIEILVPDAARTQHRRDRERYWDAPQVRPMGRHRDLIAQRRDGTTMPVEIGLNPVAASEGNLVVSAIVDLTERKLAEQLVAEQSREIEAVNSQLKELAATDALTALWNRRAFLDHLGFQKEFALRTSRPLSLLILDIDYFKAYNDQYGHLAGDEVMRQLARILRDTARRSDYVARLGGEEFGIVLPETDPAGSIRLGERFRRATEDASWPQRSITISVGATTAVFARPQDRPDSEWISQVLTEADRALYHSKDQGRNRVSHVSQLNGDS
jgi:diguanylate cyclase (GGDEF)-like protein/PAS domain S-box-containing protein